LRADVIPTTFTAEALAEVLRPGAPGLRVLIAIAEDAPPTLSSALEAAGARVTVAAAYGNRIPGGSLETIVSLFADESNLPHAVTFTSASTAANLHALIESVGIALPDTVVRASIGPITSRALADLGLPPHLQAKESTIPALVVALTDYFQAVEQP
jgi:uroporphyrinogen-III synthase